MGTFHRNSKPNSLGKRKKKNWPTVVTAQKWHSWSKVNKKESSRVWWGPGACSVRSAGTISTSVSTLNKMENYSNGLYRKMTVKAFILSYFMFCFVLFYLLEGQRGI